MSDALQRWEARHLESAKHSPPPPSASLVQAFPLLGKPHPGELALDFACGAGQNAVWLAAHGWPTVAADISPAALSRAAALARAQGVASARGSLDRLPPRFDGLLLVAADLERCPLPAAAFRLIICFHYLDRAAFPRLERALTPGAFLLYETFTAWDRHSCLSPPPSPECASHPCPPPASPHSSDQGPHSPDHLLHPGELRQSFPGLQTLFYREWCAGRAMASLLARKPS